MSRGGPGDEDQTLFDLPLKAPGARRGEEPAPPRESDPERTPTPRPIPPPAARPEPAGVDRSMERSSDPDAHGTVRDEPPPAVPPQDAPVREVAGVRRDAPGAGPSLFQLTAAGAREQLQRSDSSARSPVVAASFGRRVGAGTVDLAILAAVIGGLLGGLVWMGVPPRRDHVAPILAFAVVFSLLYLALPLAFGGRTPGMALLGLFARSRDGRPLSVRQAALRWVGSIVTLLALGLPALLGLLGLSLVDRISGSATWQGPGLGARPPRPSPDSPGR